MSSMRNAVQRRPHRERAQPKERRRLGLLEKHKDYSLRAKDYNKKKEQLKNLADKAADRNPDEFYFGMMSREGPGQRVKEGKYYTGRVKGDRGNKAMNVDLVRLLKTQDVGYVRTMRQVASKEVRKLEEQVVLTRGLDRLDEEDDEEMMGDDDDEDDDFMFDMPTKAKPARKIVFVDDEDEREELLDQIEDDNEDKEELDDKPPSEEQKQRDEDLRKLRRKLESAKKKLKVLTDAERELEEQRAKMAKTATSGGETSAGKKIKVRTRKR